MTRSAGLAAAEWGSAPALSEWRGQFVEALKGRTLIAHQAEEVRRFLVRDFSAAFARTRFLDLDDLLALTHPDAREQDGRGLMAQILGRSLRPRALGAATDALDLLLRVALGARVGEPRYQNARRALERQCADSSWLALLGKSAGFGDEAPEVDQFVEIGSSREDPVANDPDVIARVLGDGERGRRHFPDYRVRQEQIELMRGFHATLLHGGRLLLEGGTGVGKSLAYLAAAIPFAMERARSGARDPLVISTRTRLLQDQLLEKDISAAARMLGYPELRALSIKGRANYVCERRLQDTLALGTEPGLLPEDRSAYAVLLACARTRPGGEVGSLSASLLRRYPLLLDLVHRSVARRAEQCSREECAKQGRCSFGKRRAALGRAHLVVANHDLLLRWPPDYPHFEHVIADEGHELAGVADEVYARVIRPEELRERIDEIFGAPGNPVSGSDATSGLLPRKQRLEAAREVSEARRSLALDFASIGRAVVERASEYGEVELPPDPASLYPRAARTADIAARRLEELARLAEELDSRAEWSFEETPTGSSDGPSPLERNAEALREAATGLRLAFSESGEDAVAAFDRLVVPYDRWVLAIRSVSPASSFHEHFMEGLESFSAVSASLFVGGDAFAAMGELELEERSSLGVDRLVASSPFDYANHMRVAALRSRPDSEGLVQETARVIATLARLLGGRTLGLFTSLRRMKEVADLVEEELAGESIEVLAPRRAVDEPGSLVARFRSLPGGGVLLGSRTFWQGVDIPGDDLQAVVIEKLPFEVPTELRRRREARVAEFGENAFQRYRLGKMLLNLKQMTGRLIRGESDRGVVVIVEARTDRGYFGQLESAFPPGTSIRVVDAEQLPELVAEVGLGQP
ncbi:MAG: ATP-dependent DNA helicase [Myxococcota bacterium]|nr:ATP-dependent DNA helicase [Myxococcota bacterium]